MGSKHLLKQPQSFYLVFFVEIWERFGYYGVQALLVLFLVRNLGYGDIRADILFAAFSALVFLLPPIGGYVGDHVLGTKRTILLGATTLALGYFLLSLPFISNHNVILPLAVIAVGNGLFKANPSSLLAKVYEKTHRSSDSGFTLYYMAINIGSFLSMLSTPILGRMFGWEAAFSACFIGLLLAMVNFIFMRNSVSNIGSDPDNERMCLWRFSAVVLVAIALVGLCYWLLKHDQVMVWLLIFGATLLLLLFVWQMVKANSSERKGMFLFLALFFQAIVFFVLYFQVPMSLNLFTLRNVQHSIFGIPIVPAAFQSLNPFWILMMSPILAIIYQHLSFKNRDLTLPTKFAVGILLTSGAFLVLPLGIQFAHNGIISSIWIVIAYFLLSTGELLVSALGLSLVSRYVPKRIIGFTMGLWFLSVAIASIIAGKVASFANIPRYLSHNPVESLPIYSHLFLKIGLITLVISLLMFISAPFLRRIVREKKQEEEQAQKDIISMDDISFEAD